MRHADGDDLDRLEDLLARLRGLDGLREPRRGTFYVRSRALLHFHADATDLYADVRTDPAADFVRVRVTTRREQARLVADVRRALGSGRLAGSS